MLARLRKESNLLIALVVAIAAMAGEHFLLDSGRIVALLAGAVLVTVIVLVSLRVAHHAEVLAVKVGEPYGTMILTLSAVLVEVVILVMMLSHTASPTLARDTIYSAVMLDINGILGIAAILGGLRHGEQPYNVDSGNTYIVMILTGMGISTVLPAFMPQAHGQLYSIFSAVIMLGLYAMFLRLQTTRHSYFFSYAYAEGTDHGPEHGASARFSGVCVAAGIILIGALAEVMSRTVDAGLTGTGVPPILAALLVAGISASPEILTALRAALANRMQPVVNIALGASLSTVILTVPAVEFMALLTGHPMVMALTPVQMAMIALTLIVASINLNDGETNAIEGSTHFALFATFIVLACLGL